MATTRDRPLIVRDRRGFTPLHLLSSPYPRESAGAMKIDQISAATGGGQAALPFPGGVSAATAAVNDASGATGVGQQLDAYHALSSRWAGASHGERAALTHALTESPFAKTIQTAVNTFTRAAWPGADAQPPVPQQRMKDAFDGLSDDHQQIIASLQVGVPGSPPPASVDDYRARLQSDLDAAQAPAGRRRHRHPVAEAQARLAGARRPNRPRRRSRRPRKWPRRSTPTARPRGRAFAPRGDRRTGRRSRNAGFVGPSRPPDPAGDARCRQRPTCFPIDGP
jgi:hypothetical protein